MYNKLVAVAALFAATSGNAFAVFSAVPDPASVPEAPGLALFAAGVLAAGALRYLSKRRRDKDD